MCASAGALALSAVGTAQLAPLDVHRPTKRTADAIAARGDSIAAAGDTAAAMAYLEAVLYPHSTNAAAWHRYGIIQWQRAASRRGGGYIADGGTIAALRLADSALRLATKFAPDSAEYWTTLGRFNLQSDVGSMRFAATQQMEIAFHAASRVGDSSFIAHTADESGLAIWRRYETTVNRAMVTDARHVQLQTSMRWQRGHAVDFLATFAKKIEPPTGKTDYLLALERFRIAESVERSNLRYSRHLFMVLAEGRRWEELLALSNAALASRPRPTRCKARPRANRACASNGERAARAFAIASNSSHRRPSASTINRWRL